MCAMISKLRVSPQTHFTVSLFPILHFVHSFTHNLRTTCITCIQTLYISNNCSTIRDVPFLNYSCMLANWQGIVPNMHHGPFSHDILYMLQALSQKLYYAYECSTYWTTPLLSQIVLFSFRGICELWLVLYGSKHSSWSLSDLIFCAYFKRKSKTV